MSRRSRVSDSLGLSQQGTPPLGSRRLAGERSERVQVVSVSVETSRAS